ncbi:hypothetical protein CYMTET_8173 [Cymbomonas tetramitiformis]|uniref:PPPDE domain-containing protein n=1 Tax=Cymbomonas tetramitiformis TaxID=36881 RepID=A0AAE0GU81_9CHLO|nr:hypothetical protein CYMTET_8173 [Cymbomonas tetramitiformis]
MQSPIKYRVIALLLRLMRLAVAFSGSIQFIFYSTGRDTQSEKLHNIEPASPITSTESENYISDAERDEAYRVWPTKDCPPNPRPDIWAAPTCYGSRRDDEPGSPVQVRVYMIDRFGLSVVGSRVLKKEFNAIWHVGVTVHGREYNFSDKVAYMELTKTDMDLETAHGFAPSYIYEIGNTTKTKEELDQFVFGKLAKEYSIKQ